MPFSLALCGCLRATIGRLKPRSLKRPARLGKAEVCCSDARIAPLDRVVEAHTRLLSWGRAPEKLNPYRLRHVSRELYALATDPDESEDRASEFPRVADELHELLLPFLDDRNFEAPSTLLLDPELQERLESLGYVK